MALSCCCCASQQLGLSKVAFKVVKLCIVGGKAKKITGREESSVLNPVITVSRASNVSLVCQPVITGL